METVPNVVSLQQLLPSECAHSPLEERQTVGRSDDPGRGRGARRQEAPAMVDARTLLGLMRPLGLHLLKGRSLSCKLLRMWSSFLGRKMKEFQHSLGIPGGVGQISHSWRSWSFPRILGEGVSFKFLDIPARNISDGRQ